VVAMALIRQRDFHVQSTPAGDAVPGREPVAAG
jgi:hypothetical protein